MYQIWHRAYSVGNLRSFFKYSKAFYSIDTQCKKTALYDFHVSHNGKMVEFANFLMPIQYGKMGITSSHKHVRSQCGLFDVSHMLQTSIHGNDKISFIEGLIVGDIAGLKDNTGTLSLFTNNEGGIIDDLICSKVVGNRDYLYIVSNAGCREKDFNIMQNRLSTFKSLGRDVHMEVIDNALIALQGPKASQCLQHFTKFDLRLLKFMNTTEIDILGEKCRVTRCGYTGEDGFEISISQNKVNELCEKLIKLPGHMVELAGLGARDSLRLEAGLCLYGNDIDESTTPVEAGLAWTIGKRRRSEADFPGAKRIMDQLRRKPNTKRIGLVSEGPPPRSNCNIQNQDGKEIGKITSGCPSPTLGCNVAMGYVPIEYSVPGTLLSVLVRNKVVNATVTKMPFVKCNYYV